MGQGREVQLDSEQLKSALKEKCSHCKVVDYENLELREALKKLEQFVTANNLLKANEEADGEMTTNTELSFELHWSFREIRVYMEPLFSKGGDHQQVWFNGTIDRNTGKIISSGFGRIS